MKRYDSWIVALFALVIIAVPAIVGIYFLIGAEPNYSIVVGSAFGILLGGNLLTYIGYKSHLFSIESFRFVSPLTIVLFGLYLTMYQHWWVMMIVAIAGILCTFPINIIVTKIIEKKRYKIKMKAKQEMKK